MRLSDDVRRYLVVQGAEPTPDGFTGPQAVAALERELGSFRRVPVGVAVWLAWLPPVGALTFAAGSAGVLAAGDLPADEARTAAVAVVVAVVVGLAAALGCVVLTRRALAPGRLLVRSLAAWMRRSGPPGGRGHAGADRVTWTLDRTYAFTRPMLAQIALAAGSALPGLLLAAAALMYGTGSGTQAGGRAGGAAALALLALWVGAPAVVVMANVLRVNAAYLARPGRR